MALPEIPAVFYDFLHQKVELTESTDRKDWHPVVHEIEWGLPSIMLEDKHHIAATDTTIEAIWTEAAEAGLNLSVRLANSHGNLSYDDKRLNVSIDKMPNGVWKVMKFDIG